MKKAIRAQNIIDLIFLYEYQRIQIICFFHCNFLSCILWKFYLHYLNCHLLSVFKIISINYLLMTIGYAIIFFSFWYLLICLCSLSFFIIIGFIQKCKKRHYNWQQKYKGSWDYMNNYMPIKCTIQKKWTNSYKCTISQDWTRKK